MNSTCYTVNVHITGRPAKIECRDLKLSGGKTCPMLAVDGLTIYPDRDQLGVIRDAITAYLDPPTLLPDAPDFAITQRPGYAASLAADGIELVPSEVVAPLPPVCGGAIEPEYIPTEQDWAEYRAMFDQIDSEPVRPSYLAPENLIAVRRTLWGV